MRDEEIIDLYFRRDEMAITETDNKYGNYCEKIAGNILKDNLDVEECVNDTYLKTWNKIPPTRPKIFKAFLAKITRELPYLLSVSVMAISSRLKYKSIISSSLMVSPLLFYL